MTLQTSFDAKASMARYGVGGLQKRFSTKFVNFPIVGSIKVFNSIQNSRRGALWLQGHGLPLSLIKHNNRPIGFFVTPQPAEDVQAVIFVILLSAKRQSLVLQLNVMKNNVF